VDGNARTTDLVTAEDVATIVGQSRHGSYDQYHDWSPSYSLETKVALLEDLLKAWDKTEPAGHRIILEFARNLIKEATGCEYLVGDMLAAFAHVPGVSQLIKLLPAPRRR
jgi:hypothetical protein